MLHKSYVSEVVDPHYGEDGPPTNQVTHRTPFLVT